MYSAGIRSTHESPYTVALKDFLNPPKVNAIGTAEYRGAKGDPIIVNATDDFKVTRVKITIKDSNGVIIEQGDADRQWRRASQSMGIQSRQNKPKPPRHENYGRGI